jgi:hypothetical protein
LNPSRVAEQFGKVFASCGDMSRLAVLLECFAACPFLDERKSAWVVEIEEQIVADTTFFEASRGNEAFQDLAKFSFFTGFGVQMGNDINFHSDCFRAMAKLMAGEW